MPELVVATFNLHAGIDGWGRPFDVVQACLGLGADVLVLQENWTPEEGPGLAAAVAASGGYEVREARLSGALMFAPVARARAARRWEPARRDQRSARPLWVCDEKTLQKVRRRRLAVEATFGSWGIAVLSRLSLRSAATVDLGGLSRDSPGRRAAIFVEVDVDGTPLTVVGTHLAHFLHGAPVMWDRLRRLLPSADEPAVLAGDMNFWGPPVSLAFPHWRRAVHARTYPSWRAHSQIDHIFLTRAVRALSGGTAAVGRSDHLPLRARLAFG